MSFCKKIKIKSPVLHYYKQRLMLFQEYFEQFYDQFCVYFYCFGKKEQFFFYYDHILDLWSHSCFYNLIFWDLYFPVLDWVWDEQYKSSGAFLSGDSRKVSFHSDYSCGTAAIRGHKELSEGQHYWEVKMTSPVYGTDMVSTIQTY